MPLAQTPFDPTAYANQLYALLAPENRNIQPFDQTGLFNEQDVQAQAEAEFNPYFSDEIQRRLRPYTRSGEDLAFQQGQFQRQQARDIPALQENQFAQRGSQESDYLNRGLANSGGYEASQDLLGRQQARQQQEFQDASNAQKRSFQRTGEDIQYGTGETKRTTEQERLRALEDYRSQAYNRAFQQYLNQLQG